MRKTFRCILGFALALILSVSTSVAAFAESTVSYGDDNAQKFVFAPNDLFENFKNVMPGDSITQKITIRNRRLNDVKIKIYIRSLGANEGSEEFLSQLKLKVEQADDESIMFDAPADQTAQLTDWTYIGTVYSGGKIDLNLTLEVPIELDNDFQDAIGSINWQFRVEEFPVDPEDPVTGDESTIFLFALLCLLSVAVFVVLIVVRKKRTAEDK